MGVDMRGLIHRNTCGRTALVRSKRGRGAALVELAIVMPILCLLTLALMEYGWVFLKVSQINQAARHGVRTAVRPSATGDDVKAAVAALMTQAGIKDDDYVLTFGSNGTYAENGNINAAVGTPVNVHIAVNYNKLRLTGTALVPLPKKLHGHGTMAKEGPPPASPGGP